MMASTQLVLSFMTQETLRKYLHDSFVVRLL